MARRPNYGQERAERQRRKAARRDERLAAKAERRDKGSPADAGGATVETPALPVPGLDVPMSGDPVAMAQLGQALKFVCGADHPVTQAVLRAATSGDRDDIDRARVLFLQLTPENQRAALTIAAAAPSALR